VGARQMQYQRQFSPTTTVKVPISFVGEANRNYRFSSEGHQASMLESSSIDELKMTCWHCVYNGECASRVWL